MPWAWAFSSPGPRPSSFRPSLGAGAGPRRRPGRGRPPRLGRDRSAPSFSQSAHQRLHYAGTPSKLISAIICGRDLRAAEIQIRRCLEPGRFFALKLCFGQETGHLRIHASQLIRCSILHCGFRAVCMNFVLGVPRAHHLQAATAALVVGSASPRKSCRLAECFLRKCCGKRQLGRNRSAPSFSQSVSIRHSLCPLQRPHGSSRFLGVYLKQRPGSEPPLGAPRPRPWAFSSPEPPAELTHSQVQLQLLERELGQGGGQGAGALHASGETALHRAFPRVRPFAVPVPIKTRLQSDSKQILWQRLHFGEAEIQKASEEVSNQAVSSRFSCSTSISFKPDVGECGCVWVRLAGGVPVRTSSIESKQARVGGLQTLTGIKQSWAPKGVTDLHACTSQGGVLKPGTESSGSVVAQARHTRSYAASQLNR